ncbi:MAG: SO_0444 family Cu/Zn efflux transporter [Bacteroidaceae bacterium]|nr:SO_0444 family Cu/Zn efflux transporter [Bacteroidaceae bacterium]
MQEILQLLNSMSPYLLLGFLLAGIMHAFVPNNFYHKYLSRQSFRSVLNAALLGIPIPLCSCGVIPTAMSLRKEGASPGAVTSFLIATPQTGVDSIIATFSLMGLPFAIARPLAALLIAILGGSIVDKFSKKNEHHVCHCHTHVETAPKEPTCHCHTQSQPAPEHHTCHCHTSEASASKHTGFAGKMLQALRYAYVDMIQDIGKWLVIGLLIAGLITTLVPAEFFSLFQGNTMASMLLVLLLSIPMYLCATGSIPIAVALILKGLTPGAALVLLMAGPACNFASILVVRKVMGNRILATYLLSLVLGSIAMGCTVDWLQFAGYINFIDQLRIQDACCMEQTSWWAWASTILLGILLVNALVLPYLGIGKKKCACHQSK